MTTSARPSVTCEQPSYLNLHRGDLVQVRDWADMRQQVRPCGHPFDDADMELGGMKFTAAMRPLCGQPAVYLGTEPDGNLRLQFAPAEGLGPWQLVPAMLTWYRGARLPWMPAPTYADIGKSALVAVNPDLTPPGGTALIDYGAATHAVALEGSFSGLPAGPKAKYDPSYGNLNVGSRVRVRQWADLCRLAGQPDAKPVNGVWIQGIHFPGASMPLCGQAARVWEVGSPDYGVNDEDGYVCLEHEVNGHQFPHNFAPGMLEWAEAPDHSALHAGDREAEAKMPLADAIETLQHAINTDKGYAQGWFANLVMPAADAGVPHATAEQAGRAIMRHLFGVEPAHYEFKGHVFDDRFPKDLPAHPGA